jgi:hypothetical protein
LTSSYRYINKFRGIMSRKDFIAIAQAIRENIASVEQREALARAIMPALRESNSRFDSGRFMAAAVGE